ncbi:hypothetical protein HQ346_19910 [Rhodococcus sp. BP-252]|uniref:Uncharacterized protein n=1 Tax=Rhodococcoides kyotonense TaxID=398843 RepID=A0A177YL33_9NOCA|nr:MULTISPECIES: DUF6153 family protein [Rhodococcus]MBY6413963.1 hypothetical protein [Rhodococcus sp. BP-320]MBY6418587.1 hypothetical protein [Rhodococcus sp. BP-321]MBY6422882.1 hypothetical protein [Rhodococcus sp. BP-324]MBY6428769.1 hypothetical protein [Rhodococcus sp. BP-323]MBY6433708.1 hypothetical protein [Rhodococcus sp. BP-322]
MRPAIQHRRRGPLSVTGVLVALTVFGVLLMHSVMPVTSMNGPQMTARHSAMAPTPRVDSSVPVAFGEHDCPSGHQMMHPCVGTTVSWPALTIPSVSIDATPSLLSANGLDARAVTTQERAPPWTLWELDRSVTLRV